MCPRQLLLIDTYPELKILLSMNFGVKLVSYPPIGKFDSDQHFVNALHEAVAPIAALPEKLFSLALLYPK